MVSFGDTIRRQIGGQRFRWLVEVAMETTASFGSWIRRQRKILDLTQQGLADKVGCSVAAIKKIEQDEQRPSRQIAERMADVLGIPPDHREIFLEVARGLRSVDQLSLAHGAASSLPTGTVTFLFTDIESSTQIARQYSQTWESSRARHHAILREAITANKGYVFQIVGDAFCAAFDNANDGIHAALEAQRKLQTGKWGAVPMKVRMGIHTGEAEAQDDEYRGYLTLSLVQQLMSAGHGGQILISHTTEILLRGQLPQDVSLRDLGEYKFKAASSPVRVFQVLVPDLQKEFPALRTLEVLPNNLPVQLTSFIGRGQEIDLVHQYLSKEHFRLVTLMGPPGIGKTRLSIEAARSALQFFSDGVFFVALAPLEDPNVIASAVAQALGYVAARNIGTTEQLKEGIGDKHMLLVLDNCEHLIESVASLASELLSACPQLKILATSREAFGVQQGTA